MACSIRYGCIPVKLGLSTEPPHGQERQGRSQATTAEAHRLCSFKVDQSTLALVVNPIVPVGVLVFVVSIWIAGDPVDIINDILCVMIPDAMKEVVYIP